MHIFNENCNFTDHSPRDNETPTIEYHEMPNTEMVTDNETLTVEMVTGNINTSMY